MKPRLQKFIIEPAHWDEYPFQKDEIVIFLNEIENMPEHGVYVKKDGRTIFGYHIDNFVDLTEDEV